MPLRNTIALVIISLLATVVLLNTSTGARDAADLLVLSERNTVSLAAPIDGDSVRNISEELLTKSDKLRANEPIYLVLNSPGGSIGDGLRLITLIQGLPQKVHTLSLFSASMSFITSQYLSTRYVVQDSVLMSHRAMASEMEGQVPGTLNSRVDALTDDITRIEQTIADRAGMSLANYQKAVTNELWLSAGGAIAMKMADRLVRVRCDDTLRGYGPSQTFRLFIFTVTLQFHKCPLITTPKVVSGDARAIALFTATPAERVRLLNQR